MKWKLEEQLCFLLYANARMITKAYKDILDPFNLTYTQYVTLIALWEKDHQLVSELGAKLRLDSGTLTPLLKKLERDGTITRTRGSEDNRKVYIDLTSKGRQLALDCAIVPEKILAKIPFSKEMIEPLYDILKVFYQEEGERL